ncbi:SUKH-3 domain-containing protein [Streptomyces sp. SS]|uniref:SUKH-3 domain-containing protein n=1 Tax=Streptomyces sp. SS TaxID=260742 RepID=UPI0003142E7B|nr:SUKH-3 domain-containing protein [Streptomyces sp. SS]
MTTEQTATEQTAVEQATTEQTAVERTTTDLPTTGLPTTGLPPTDLPTTDLSTTDLSTTGLPTTGPAAARAAAADGMSGGEGDSSLVRAGWHPGRDAGDAAMLAVLKTAGMGPWALFPAAERAVREFHGLRPEPAAHGGREVAATGCVVDPQEARYSGPPLHRLADQLGTRLFPLGRTAADAPMAVDEEGRLFSLGAGGAWFHGETVRDGLLALTEGLRPVRLRGREWQWPLRAEPADLAAGVRAALVAVYVLHTHGVFDARTLRLRATTLRGIGVTVLDQDFPLRRGSLEDNAPSLVEAMEAELSALARTTPASCELLLTVPAPPRTAAPAAGVDCAVTLGGPNGFALTLAAGPGASIGRPAAALDACVAAFDAWAATL